MRGRPAEMRTYVRHGGDGPRSQRGRRADRPAVQLALGGADTARGRARRSGASRCRGAMRPALLFALRSAPAPLVEHLLDEVVGEDARLRGARRAVWSGWPSGAARGPRRSRRRASRSSTSRRRASARPRASSRSAPCGSRACRRSRGSSGWSTPACRCRRPSAADGHRARATCAAPGRSGRRSRSCSRSRPAACWSRTTRASTSACSTARCGPATARRLALPGAGHRRARAAPAARGAWPASTWPRWPSASTTSVRPCHRALPDALATAEVLARAARARPGARRARRSRT